MSSTPATSRALPARSTPPPTSAVARSGVSRTASARSSPVNGRPAPPRKMDSDSPNKPMSVKEQLEMQLRREQEEKGNLSLRLEDATKAIQEHDSINVSLRSSLQLAESRLAQLSADALRTETSMSDQTDLVSALREQLASMERERREVEKRYREQAEAFELERQAQWEAEHVSRQRLERLEIRLRRAEARVVKGGLQPETEDDGQEEIDKVDTPKIENLPKREDKDQEEPPEMTMMRLEMDSLSGAFTTLQNTHQILLQEMADLKRVNQQIQEENESYNVLLRERTLAGTFHLPGTSPYSDNVSLDEDVYSKAGSRLDPVSEDAEVRELEGGDQFPVLSSKRDSSPVSSVPSSRQRRRRASAGSAKGVGESLAGFPVSGPGEDLAAELGRAEARDGVPEVAVESPKNPKKEDNSSVASMRAEIQALKDANKALSLYAAKILDRIIADEGFEHVLAADYNKDGPANAHTSTNRPDRTSSLTRSKTVAGHGRRPASATLSGVRDQPQEQIPNHNAPPPMMASKSEPPSSMQQQPKRRSMSIDWKGLWGGGTQEKKNESLRPLSLATAATPAPPKPPMHTVVPTRTRFIPRDTEEDEEDQRERERLNATMKLMGIERASSYRQSEQPADDLSHLDAARHSTTFASDIATKGDRRRTSLMRSPSPNTVGLPGSTPQQRVSSTMSYRLSSDFSTNGGLTSDALAEAGAAHALAELDAEERRISEQLAKGKIHHGGFTPSARELAEANTENGASGGTGLMRRSSRRARTGRESSGTMSVGSVSTVWSAGRTSGSSTGDGAAE
ncbi:hypothetical protein DACRYDRAFT_109312 [Dacryopinax primogenitus]|uniref:Uncharacterized protein n=1 Tax=Dacryopinax primogenitus (strain DJM 731) TaxID=1858805 RepID=M5FUH8_DACPD|nr:uncharacterized protein DACRYDRAFT_109312 [Dacryopinax primogenitus]EJT99888.1 hypothetical protein DACRYDRAFT_109312 [Dacryopinax primogenitus]